MKAVVLVRPKAGILDPQGEAIRKACGTLGHSAVRSVRQGKLFEIELDARDPEEAKRLLNELSDKLLANTVIEDYRVAEIG